MNDVGITSCHPSVGTVQLPTHSGDIFQMLFRMSTNACLCKTVNHAHVKETNMILMILSALALTLFSFLSLSCLTVSCRVGEA